MEQSSGPKAIYPADIDEAGSVLLPADLRQLMNIEIGDDVAWVKTEFWLRLIKVTDENE